MAVTIRDVAKVAGVSLKTVSRVINDEPYVHAETRARVRKAVESLGFHPNPIARGLNTKRMQTLGLVVPDISNPFFAKGIDGCVAMAEQHGYNLILGSFSDDTERNAQRLRALLAQRVSGIILWASNVTAASVLEAMQRVAHLCPVVFVDCPISPAAPAQQRYESLLVAQEDVGALATDHLLNEGRRRIAHISQVGHGTGTWAAEQRFQGYAKTLASHGIAPEDGWIQRAMYTTIPEGARVAAALLAQRPRPDAIFAYNDLLAVGALQACRKAQVRVPEDVAIVGVDDTEIAAVTNPPLTTVRLHQFETGKYAASLLLGLVTADRSSVSREALAPDLPRPELVVRRSSTTRSLPDGAADDVVVSDQSPPTR